MRTHRGDPGTRGGFLLLLLLLLLSLAHTGGASRRALLRKELSSGAARTVFSNPFVMRSGLILPPLPVRERVIHFPAHVDHSNCCSSINSLDGVVLSRVQVSLSLLENSPEKLPPCFLAPIIFFALGILIHLFVKYAVSLKSVFMS